MLKTLFHHVANSLNSLRLPGNPLTHNDSPPTQARLPSALRGDGAATAAPGAQRATLLSSQGEYFEVYDFGSDEHGRELVSQAAGVAADAAPQCHPSDKMLEACAPDGSVMPAGDGDGGGGFRTAVMTADPSTSSPDVPTAPYPTQPPRMPSMGSIVTEADEIVNQPMAVASMQDPSRSQEVLGRDVVRWMGMGSC